MTPIYHWCRARLAGRVADGEAVGHAAREDIAAQHLAVIQRIDDEGMAHLPYLSH